MTVPPAKDQIELIKELLKRPLVKDAKMFLISIKWFKAWTEYTCIGFEPWNTVPTHPPGPVDNSDILQENGLLKELLVDDLDYIFICEDGWNVICSWCGFSNQTSLPRMVIEQGMFVKHLSVEVYPLNLLVSEYPNLETHHAIEMSRADTIGKLEMTMKKIFEIKEDENTTLFYKYMSNTYESILEKEQTLQDAALYTGQKIVIARTDKDGKWPSLGFIQDNLRQLEKHVTKHPQPQEKGCPKTEVKCPKKKETSIKDVQKSLTEKQLECDKLKNELEKGKLDNTKMYQEMVIVTKENGELKKQLEKEKSSCKDLESKLCNAIAENNQLIEKVNKLSLKLTDLKANQLPQTDWTDKQKNAENPDFSDSIHEKVIDAENKRESNVPNPVEKLSPPISTEHVEVAEIFCSLCFQSHLNVPAVVHCPECEEFLCNDCIKHHAISRWTKFHSTLPIEEYSQLPLFVKSLTGFCNNHEKALEIYCQDHETACCLLCMPDHKDCKSISAIRDVAKYIKTSSVMVDIKQTATDLIKYTDDILDKLAAEETKISEQQNSIIDKIKKERKAIDDHLNAVEGITTHEVFDIVQRHIAGLDKTRNEVTEKRDKLTALFADVENTDKYASNFQTLSSVKQFELVLEKAEKDLKTVYECGTGIQLSELKFSSNELLVKVSAVNSFGTVEEQRSQTLIQLVKHKNKQAQV